MIKALIMDVDGTLTNGSIYIGNSGEMMKCFHVRDGYAIKHMLPEMQIVPIIITGRCSKIVQERCKELDIEFIVQGTQDKIKDMIQILNKLGIDMENTAYIGDDLNDLECMQKVQISACPSDAMVEVKKICTYVCQSKGGEGAVREFIEWLRDK